MRRPLVLSLVVVLALTFGAPAASAAPAGSTQDSPTTTLAELPPAEIIPRPNSGAAPQDAGDRGGALQLGLLALVVVVIGGGVAHLVRQSRRTGIKDS